MARRWTAKEEYQLRRELQTLYVTQNKTIAEISKILGIKSNSVYDRLVRLGIPTQRHAKPFADNRRQDIFIPNRHTARLAEFFGIMLGDGHVSHFQTTVELGSKEEAYAIAVADIMEELFGCRPTIGVRANGYRTVYLGSVRLTTWLKKEGLVSNKVKAQVGVPAWICANDGYVRAFLRGFFDTDGSIYLLRYGIQISLTNHSLPLLRALHSMLISLEYAPSRLSTWRIYLTRRKDVLRFFREIHPRNPKHVSRFCSFIVMRRSDSGYSRRL